MKSLKLFAFFALMVFASFARSAESPATTLTNDQLVARGKYIVSTSGCHDCHTPWKMTAEGPAPDMSLALSGHPGQLVMPVGPQPAEPWLITIAATNTAFAGPWGVSFTANLTPDRETGLGKWTARTFIDTIRTGRHLGRGRAVLPPMPIMVYKNFTDEDLTAIFSYLQSLPAIRNKVPEPRAPGQAVASAPSQPGS